MPSKIRLQFNSTPADGSLVTLKPSYSPNGMSETFKDLRTSIYKVTISAIIPEQQQNYFNAFTADYNSLGLFTLFSETTSILAITHPNTGFFVIGDVVNTTSGAVTILDVTDTPDPTLINITDVSFSEATSACTDVQLDITTDVLAVKYRVNSGSDIVNAINPFDFEWIRGALINLEVENTEGYTSNQNIQIPQTLSASNTSISVINSPSGATVTVTVINATGLDLQYSLDDITYQVSNIFPSITEGSYTMYVKDQLGCTVQKDFEVADFEEDGINARVPIVTVPESNSFRHVKVDDFSTTHRKDSNTLSCQAYARDPRMRYAEYQQFLTIDTPRNQFKSSYDNITATVVKEDLTEIPLVIEQMTDWRNLKDRLDGIKYDLGDGKTGVYFTTGNTYDPDTGTPTGTHALNGGLPYWGTIGNYMFFEGTWFEIENTIYDASRFSKVLVISNTYTGIDATIDITSIYNREDYDVWEYSTALSAYTDELVQVRINFDDSTFDSEVYITEKIIVKAPLAGTLAGTFPETVEIRCWNDSNTDIYYQTGIKHLIRMPLDRKDSAIDDNTEIHKTDTQSVLLETKVYPLKKFTYLPTTDGIRWLLVLMLSRDNIQKDGENYIKNGSSIEHEDALEDSNLYIVTATMLKAGGGFTSSGETDSSFAPVNVPSLLKSTSGGFVKIKV